MARRRFLATTGRAAGAAVLAPSLQGLVACAAEAERSGSVPAHPGYGPLQPAGNELALPTGFAYRVFGIEGEPMADGRPTPNAHDGMAAFPGPDGTVRLLRNHEDRERAGLYRFLPDRPGDLRAGGRLEMLAAADRPGADLARGQTPGRPLPVRWVPIEEPDPPDASSDPEAVFRQGREGGGARFSRL